MSVINQFNDSNDIAMNDRSSKEIKDTIETLPSKVKAVSVEGKKQRQEVLLKQELSRPWQNV